MEIWMVPSSSPALSKGAAARRLRARGRGVRRSPFEIRECGGSRAIDGETDSDQDDRSAESPLQPLVSA